MPRLTKKEWILIKYACRNLWDSLDITNGDIQYRQPDIFKENKKDMETLNNIIKKIEMMGCDK